MIKDKRKKRKKNVFKKIEFKLSVRQKKSLETFCQQKNTTLIKLIKKSIDTYIQKQMDSNEDDHISPNQLFLFDVDEYDLVSGSKHKKHKPPTEESV